MKIICYKNTLKNIYEQEQLHNTHIVTILTHKIVSQYPPFSENMSWQMNHLEVHIKFYIVSLNHQETQRVCLIGKRSKRRLNLLCTMQ